MYVCEAVAPTGQTGPFLRASDVVIELSIHKAQPLGTIMPLSGFTGDGPGVFA